MLKKAAPLFLLLIALLLTSCWDAFDPDEMLHVWAIGVDRGLADKWRLTLLFSSLEELTGGGEDAGVSRQERSSKEDTIVIDAPSFFTGIDMLNSAIPRRLSFTHAQTIIFSEELAASGLVDNYIMPIIRFRQIRKSARVLVVKGAAQDFLEGVAPFAGSSVSEDLQFLGRESKNTGLSPVVTLNHFYTALNSPYYQPIATLAALNDFKSLPKEGEPWGTQFQTGGQYLAGALPRAGEGKVEFFGTALFRDGEMVGELNGDQTRFLLMVRGEFRRGFFTMEDPKQPDLIIPLDVRALREPRIRVELQGNKALIDVAVRLDLDLLAVQSKLHYEQQPLKGLLEEKFQTIVKTGIEDVIRNCQSLNVDVFMFGNHTTKDFLTVPAAENFNWNERFQNAEITVEVKAAIRRTGRQIVL